MALVRTLTFFMPINLLKENMKKDLEKHYMKAMDILDRIDIKPWTVRFVFPPLYHKVEKKECRKMIRELYKIIPEKNILVNALPIPSTSKSIEYLVDIISEHNTLYSTIYLKNYRDIKRIVRNIYMRRDIEYDIFTRISITHYLWVQTPYFPSTVNLDGKFGFGLAFRYVDLIRDYLTGNKEKLIAFLRKIKDSLGDSIKYFKGVDYSISPWMEESIAQVIEEVYKVKIGDVGSFNSVYKLNMEIKKICNKGILNGIGFNETMLPVGEDNLLKERVREGILNLRVLMALSSVCVAGLDMVAVSQDQRLIEMILHDMNVFARIKRKGLGTRLIPVQEESIYSKKFGYIPRIRC